jgi:maleylpyruvate isomerase
MKLYTYWRSSCSWRVRIALNLKGLNYELHPVHLVKDGGEQHSEWYREINPQAQLPTLELDDGNHLTQSMAIMMYLERVHPAVSLLPTEPLLYAKIIQLAEIINAGIQPLQNLSVLQFLNAQDPSKELSMSWARGVIQRGLEDLESLVAESNTQFLLTDTPTIAECCLIPQLYNARRFGCDLSKTPKLLEVEQACEKLEAFQQAHPSVQPDAQ